MPQFANADYDAAMTNFLRAGDEAGQVAAARAMDDGRRTTTPILPVSFTLESDYVPPWVKGFRPNVFTSCWNYLDVDRPVRR